jgi:hypothetical protein
MGQKSHTLRSPGIDTNESIPPAYVAWRACASIRVVERARKARNRVLGSLKALQIRAQESIPRNRLRRAYVAWRAGTTTLFLYSFLSPHRWF